jgi:hypothetical protein
MKHFAYIFFIILLTIGCSRAKLEGTFIKVKENDRGSSMNLLGLSLIEKVYFTDSHYRFEYAGNPMSAEYKVDKNYVYIDVGGDLGTLTMEIIDDKMLEGEGLISGTFRKQ